ncbi:MAG: SDR family oxidoreductase [Cyanobacteria bacterium]|nr:SDR family oxidoreductase [Cyanobacteriota bacterium]
MSRRTKLLPGFAGIITGASTGIGRSLAIELAKTYRARLVLNARDAEALEKVCQTIRAEGLPCISVAGDVSDKEVQQQLVSTCMDEFGELDLLVNNAGMANPGRMVDLSMDNWRRVFEVNFFAPLSLIYLALPILQERGGGTIINVSSVAGKVAFSGSVCYASSKFALTALSEGMAAELAGMDVNVITVCPGWVRTEFFEKNNVSARKNPTLIASQSNIEGWLMRNVLSTSSDQTAEEIVAALKQGGSHELVTTIPGKMVERINGVCPNLVQAFNRKIPIDLVDSSGRKPSLTKADKGQTET